MLSIEEYIARRKKEDGINEFDFDARLQNLKACVGYLFEYFMNYLGTTEAEHRTGLINDKRGKYIKQLDGYSSEIRDWVIGIYDEYGKQMISSIANAMKEHELFFLYNEDSEFRSVSYDCYVKLIKKLPFLREQTEMLFRCIKEYHRVKSQVDYDYGIPKITDEIDNWLESTWLSHRVNLAKFAFGWTNMFFDNVEIWPSSHRLKSKDTYREYEYDYKQKSNLFNIDSLYKRIPKKSYLKGRKQELEILFMYYWLHFMEGDDTRYWEHYLEKVTPHAHHIQTE